MSRVICAGRRAVNWAWCETLAMRFTFTIDSTDPERLATFWAAASRPTSEGFAYP